jgi:hypothetical protein
MVVGVTVTSVTPVLRQTLTGWTGGQELSRPAIPGTPVR